MKFCAHFLLLQIFVLVSSQSTVLDTGISLLVYKTFRNWILNTFGKPGDARARQLADVPIEKLQEQVPDYIPFPCNVTGSRSAKVPDSVDYLRPGDIDVIGAIGDSLTAGAAVFSTNLFQILVENRGVSAFAGGQGTWREFLTIPNILKEYNPNLVGYAYADSLTTNEESQFNVAFSGAISEDMPYMAKFLIRRIKNDPRVNFKKDWKFVSMLIGANDFCSYICNYASPWSILNYHKKHLMEVLRTFRDNLPRSVVAVIAPPNLKQLVATRKGRESLSCYLTTNVECPCMFGLMYAHNKAEYYEVMKRWQELEEEIVNLPEFHTKDFTALYLPILKQSGIPIAEDGFADMTYMAEDCFHVTQKSNARLSNGVWNNLLEPIGNKSKTWLPLFEKLLCPTTERPYLVTRGNSGKEVKGT